MSWKTFHNRGETLRAVVDTANERRDGLLPMSEPGVAEHFTDDLDLIGALLLKWHARLSGNLERALVLEPMDLEAAVASAWRTTAEQLPGVRLVIDQCTDHPDHPAMARAMSRAREHEWTRLAVAAGLASARGHAALEAGHRVEERARATLDVSSGPTPTDTAATTSRTTSFVDRIKAVLAA
jgi:hypothetical protein